MKTGEGDKQNERTGRDLARGTKQFALPTIKMYSGLPQETVAQVIGKQVFRSGTAVGANYRQANQGRTKAEFVAKIGDCLKELDKTVQWLELLVEAPIVAPPRLSALLDETSQLIAIFATIINRTKERVA